MPDAGEHPREPLLVGGGDHFIISDGAAGLYNCGCPCISRRQKTVCKWEECIRCHYRPLSQRLRLFGGFCWAWAAFVCCRFALASPRAGPGCGAAGGSEGSGAERADGAPNRAGGGRPKEGEPRSGVRLSLAWRGAPRSPGSACFQPPPTRSAESTRTLPCASHAHH